MASRKQRRRRAKGRRHEYEYVYVDDEGHEVEAPPEGAGGRRLRDGKNGRGGAKVSRAGGSRSIREVKPPDWKRSVKRAALFLPLFFIVFSLVNKSMPVATRIISSLAYSALFVPLTYWMDRMAYRTYLRRSGKAS
jgi:hypothetical protein